MKTFATPTRILLHRLSRSAWRTQGYPSAESLGGGGRTQLGGYISLLPTAGWKCCVTYHKGHFWRGNTQMLMCTGKSWAGRRMIWIQLVCLELRNNFSSFKTLKHDVLHHSCNETLWKDIVLIVSWQFGDKVVLESFGTEPQVENDHAVG